MSNKPSWYIFSRNPGRKTWQRHIPAFLREEAAQNQIEEWKFYNPENTREYRVEHAA